MILPIDEYCRASNSRNWHSCSPRRTKETRSQSNPLRFHRNNFRRNRRWYPRCVGHYASNSYVALRSCSGRRHHICPLRRSAPGGMPCCKLSSFTPGPSRRPRCCPEIRIRSVGERCPSNSFAHSASWTPATRRPGFRFVSQMVSVRARLPTRTTEGAAMPTAFSQKVPGYSRTPCAR
jgi:hypothetical protein